MENMEGIVENIYNLILTYGLKLLYAIFVLLIGLWIIKGIIRFINNVMDKRELDASLRPFMKSLVGMSLKIILFITVFGMLGVQMTSFIALLGAAGLAVGMALSGTLQNFAGGVIILVFKPFKVGDFIEAQGYAGFVKEIQIFNTILTTFQNKTIILPNSAVSSNSIVNITANGTIRVDMEIGISYDSNIAQAKQVILDTIAKNDKVLKDPACAVGVNALADSSVNLLVMPWCNTDDYWDVYFGVREDIKNALDDANITIPFPQRDVHIINNES